LLPGRLVAAVAVHLDLDYIRYVESREHEHFNDDTTRQVAELVAFDVFLPALRSRGTCLEDRGMPRCEPGPLRSSVWG
jgi:hypothetical protein